MTNKEAIEHTIILWSFLADDGSRVKEDHPDYEGYQEFRATCPLCHTFHDDVGECGDCPLNTPELQCDMAGSPFKVWDTSSSEVVCQKAAQRLVDALRLQYKE